MSTTTLKKWSDKEQARLVELYNQGLDDMQIAERLGKSLAAIKRKRVRLGIRRVPKSIWEENPEMDATLQKMVATGVPYEEIAKKLGVGIGSVQHRVKVLGIKTGRVSHAWTIEEKEALLNMQHLSTAEAAEILNRSENAVSAQRYRMATQAPTPNVKPSRERLRASRLATQQRIASLQPKQRQPDFYDNLFEQ